MKQGIEIYTSYNDIGSNIIRVDRYNNKYHIDIRCYGRGLEYVTAQERVSSLQEKNQIIINVCMFFMD
jgi:hypothetical protein